MTGYQSKKAMSQDKLNDDDDTQVYGDAVDNNPVHEAMLFYWGERCSAYHEECVCCQAWEQYDGKKAALTGREWNFCERCGKRTRDLTTIHTCTPPQKSNAQE